jgi:predicted PurR-regulated permease PerM
LISPQLTRPNEATQVFRPLTLVAVAVVIAGLYFGRQVLIPLSLAVILAFLFTPVVDWLQKCHLGRVPAVLIVWLLTFSMLGSIGWVVAGQLMDIADRLPSYRSNIHDKILSVRVLNGSRLKDVTNTVNELGNELAAASELAADKKNGKPVNARPIPVQVAQPPSNATQYVRTLVGPLTGIIETGLMVLVFTLFMLVKREDLRDRVIRLAGQGQLNVVTQALDDASRRLSRYLLLQFTINTTYGILFGVGAYLIGIPHPLLWGALSGLLRFLPYIGTPIAAIFPTIMALAVFPGWHQAGLIFGLFIVLDLIIANVAEPWLYGVHTGLSSLAILVAAVFWTMLWGPVGLILSTPLSLCLILVGRYVPHLSFLEVLLGDEAVLSVEARFYQRLLALDQEEAIGIAEAYLKEKPIGSFYDNVLIPALTLAERDRHLDSVEAGVSSFVGETVRELIEELGEQSLDDLALFERVEGNKNNLGERVLSSLRVIVIPAGDEADELASMAVEQLANRLGSHARRLSLSPRENIVNEFCRDGSEIAIISALPPFAAGPARSLCKQLRQNHLEMKIILGLWGFEGGVGKARDRVGTGCTDLIATSMEEVISLLMEIERSNKLSRPAQPPNAFHREITATGSL